MEEAKEGYMPVNKRALLFSGTLFLKVLLLFQNASLNIQAVADTKLPIASPETVGMSTERLVRITRAMQGYIDRKDIPGVVTLVARGGKVVHLEALGYRDVEKGAPLGTDSIFRIASMTKPLVSVAAMMLFEEGHFLLSDPISKWLPEFSNLTISVASADGLQRSPLDTFPATSPITVQHILTHTAGLANNYRGLNQAEYLKIAARKNAEETIGDFVKRLARLPLNFEPGTDWEYSRATCVVGRLIEVISGQTLDAFMRKQIFEPLGLSDTHFYLPVSKLSRFTSEYRPDDSGKIVLVQAADEESSYVKEPHLYFSGSGGLVSTVSDYFRFLQMMLNGGELDGTRLLGKKTVELMTVNHIGDETVWLRGPGYGFGLGFSVLRDRGLAGNPASEGSYGWGGAYCTFFWVDPIESVIGVMMTQVRPYTHLNIRREFQVLTNQAIVE